MPKRNNHNRSRRWQFTGDMGYLIPFGWWFVNPGEIFRHGTRALIRTPPLDYPVMHRVFVRIHHFYVAFEAIYEGWRQFWTGGEDGGNADTHPYIQASTVTHSTLLNYLGLPAMAYGSTRNFNALPLRAYNKIYNDYYRDSQIISEATIDTTDGLDTTTNTTLHRVAMAKDRFSTIRSEPQLGDALTVSVGGETFVEVDGSTVSSSSNISVQDGAAAHKKLRSDGTHDYLSSTAQDDNDYRMKVDLAEASGLSVDDFFLSMALQKDRVKKNNFGGRYQEVIGHEFGMRNLDNQLDRAWYLGGGKNLLQYSEVLSTDGSNTGDLYGHGLGAMKANKYQRLFPEHGIVMSLMSVIPENLYPEAIDRPFLYDNRTDYYDPDLEYIGEQEVTCGEYQADHSTPSAVLGYQKQYDEYRSSFNFAAGLFGTGQSKNNTHFGLEISGDAALNQSYIDCVPTKRVQQDTNAPALEVYALHDVVAKSRMARNPMPKYI